MARRTWDAYPNLGAAVGTSVPVVTTVLAAISAATFLVPLQNWSRDASPQVGLLPWSSAKLTIVLGVLATASFVLSTLAAVDAHATSLDLLPTDRRAELLTGVEPDHKEVLEAHYRTQTRRRYELARTLWMIGLGLLALTIGALAYRLVAAMMPAAGVAGAWVGVSTIRGSSGWVGNLVGGVLLVASLTLAVAALLG
jgi:hypothetical protein